MLQQCSNQRQKQRCTKVQVCDARRATAADLRSRISSSSGRRGGPEEDHRRRTRRRITAPASSLQPPPPLGHHLRRKAVEEIVARGRRRRCYYCCNRPADTSRCCGSQSQLHQQQRLRMLSRGAPGRRIVDERAVVLHDLDQGPQFKSHRRLSATKTQSVRETGSRES